MAAASARFAVVLIVGMYMVVTIGSAMRHEEENMRVQFGREYEAYLRTTAIPFTRAFSVERAMTVNKEYKAIVGLVVAGLMLAAKVALNAD